MEADCPGSLAMHTRVTENNYITMGRMCPCVHRGLEQILYFSSVHLCLLHFSAWSGMGVSFLSIPLPRAIISKPQTLPGSEHSPCSLPFYLKMCWVLGTGDTPDDHLSSNKHSSGDPFSLDSQLDLSPSPPLAPTPTLLLAFCPLFSLTLLLSKWLFFSAKLVHQSQRQTPGLPPVP